MSTDSTSQSNLTYDDLLPKFETKETPKSHLLLIHLPGFERENIGARFEFDYRRVRVYGRQQVGENRFSRFNIAYPVPGNCDVNKLKGKFEGGTYTVIMPKKVISRELPKELKPNEREAPKSPTHTTEPKPETVQEDIPPKPTTAAERERATAAEVEAEKDKVGISQEPKSTTESQEQADEASTPPKATSDSMPQKDQEESAKDKKSSIPKNAEDEKGDIKSKGKGIVDAAASASQAMTSLVKRLREEDKQMLIYTSATVLVVALGVYASYKFRSSARP